MAEFHIRATLGATPTHQKVLYIIPNVATEPSFTQKRYASVPQLSVAACMVI